ncbi:MAG: type ISP restriction/modification enzyme, partial [Dolichospermum sp.]
NFINYVRPEVRDFREAIDTFRHDLPIILDSLRKLIKCQEGNNILFETARNKFWELCQKSINPEITLLDIREMMIQHILTEDIFINIFSESQFHQENNVARELQGVISTFFTGSLKRNTLGSIERYYAVIRRTAANIVNHQEKQKFLKALYENFYKAYNPKAADRLGIVYTPNEIVRFMIESTDFLVHKHFGKLLADKDVEILDPATGTGTFITELIDYLPPHSLQHKYKHEIHCNEVAILPYYIANLNIEYTYKQKMGVYEEFENICFMDTLDYSLFEGKQMDLFAMTLENTARIKRQNDRTISVIIGNPPYNANQQNENDNNKNRSYPTIDKLIKQSYVKYSNAQKTKRYDMYSRFFRWATNRLNENGILAFITNSSFIHSKEADGFRKAVADEFSEIYIIDLGGDIRAGDKTGNVFNVQVGIAISFMIKKSDHNHLPCKIFYSQFFGLNNTFKTVQSKLEYISKSKFSDIHFQHITPDNNNWVNIASNDFESLLMLADKHTKFTKIYDEEKALYKLFSLGISTNRDEWVIDTNLDSLKSKMIFFTDFYNNYEHQEGEDFNSAIKWSRNLKRRYIQSKKEGFDETRIKFIFYRPFCKFLIYKSNIFLDETGAADEIYLNTKENKIITYSFGQRSNFCVLATQHLFSLDIYLPNATQCLPLYRYDKEGKRIDNITDWGLKQIQTHYQDETITKIDIFHYTYAVLHNPAYRTKYELNLKRDFPRLPYYENFPKWVNWGKQLMEIHINYETVTPYNLTRLDIPLKDTPSTSLRERQKTIKVKLKADKTKDSIILDDITTLTEIPAIAWEYLLGNRSALEWILDQYKEKKPKDPTIAEKFNTYRFADYKEQVIDLLMRVCTVSVETMKIIKEMSESGSPGFEDFQDFRSPTSQTN